MLATLTSPHWETKVSKPIEKGPFYYFAYCLNAAFFLQLLMGATMRHTGAGLAIPDFPMAFGQWLPPFFTDAILIHFMHRTFAFVLLFLVGLFVAILYKKYPEQLVLTTFAGLLFSLVTFQILLGAMSIWLRKPVVITMSHLAVGALCFGCSVVVTSLMARQIKTEEIFIQWSPA
jgi:cytochrome c oxidase assembly protein subunit 15